MVFLCSRYSAWRNRTTIRRATVRARATGAYANFRCSSWTTNRGYYFLTSIGYQWEKSRYNSNKIRENKENSMVLLCSRYSDWRSQTTIRRAVRARSTTDAYANFRCPSWTTNRSYYYFLTSIGYQWEKSRYNNSNKIKEGIRKIVWCSFCSRYSDWRSQTTKIRRAVRARSTTGAYANFRCSSWTTNRSSSSQYHHRDYELLNPEYAKDSKKLAIPAFTYRFVIIKASNKNMQYGCFLSDDISDISLCPYLDEYFYIKEKNVCSKRKSYTSTR